MCRRIIIFGFIWAWITAVSPALAEVQVSASVDRTAISPGESLQLEVRVSGGSGGVDISPIKDFKVHSRSTSNSVQIINGRLTKEVVYNYVLMHMRQGELTIPPLTVMVDGRAYETDPINVTVTGLSPSDNTDANRNREVWVTAELSDKAPYVGQQFAYTFRVLNSVQINDAKFQPPEFTGFSAKEIEERKSYRKMINGREHVVTEVNFVLTPLRDGPVIIDPAVLHVGVIRQNRSRSRSPFDNFFNRNIVEPRVLQTDPIELSVRALPTPTSPQMFSGLVGRFELTAEMESTVLNVGDSATLTITLGGEGNIIDAQPPELSLPTAFKSYADNPEEEIELGRTGTKGKKVFRTALVPIEPGVYELQDINVIYFDIEKEAYQTLRAELPTINVTASSSPRKAPLTVTPETLPRLKKKVAFTGRDILPPKEGITAIQPQSSLGWQAFLLYLTGPALFFGCAAMVQHIRRPQTSANAIMKNKAHQSLKAAGNSSGEEFLTSLYQALTAAIYSVAHRTGEALTWKEAESLLLENNIAAPDARDAAKLLANIESYKFSGHPLEEDKRRELLDQTRKMVRILAS